MVPGQRVWNSAGAMTAEGAARLLPNILSLGRMLMTPVVCILLWRQAWGAALAWLLAAALTDLLDGWLARRQGWRSSLGALLDPLADKVLVISVAATLWLLALLPGWLLLLIVLRDAVIMGGAAAWRWNTGELQGEPLMLGKLATLMLLVLLLITPASRLLAPPGETVLLPGMHWLVAFLLILSGGAYVRTWWRRWVAFRETR